VARIAVRVQAEVSGVDQATADSALGFGFV